MDMREGMLLVEELEDNHMKQEQVPMKWLVDKLPHSLVEGRLVLEQQRKGYRLVVVGGIVVVVVGTAVVLGIEQEGIVLQEDKRFGSNCQGKTYVTNK